MEDAVSASDANRRFSKLLRRVRDGHSVVVTSHGRHVARILPVEEGDGPLPRGARATLMARLRAQRVVNVGRWTREELYEDER